MQTWKSKLRCTYKGRFFYEGDTIDQDEKPNRHFELFVSPESDAGPVVSDEAESMLEVQITEKSIPQIKKWIEQTYPGAVLDVVGQKKKDVIAEAMKIVRDPDHKRRAASDIDTV